MSTFQSTSIRSVVSVVAGLTMLVLGPSAKAALVAYEFSGTIMNNSSAFVAPGTPFQGSFSYQDDLIGDTRVFGTNYFPGDFSLSILDADYEFQMAINVVNDGNTLLDADYVQLGRFGFSPPLLINAIEVEGIELSFVDTTETVFSDVSLPTAYDLDDWTSALLAVRRVGSQDVMFGRIESLNPVVPVPAAVWLFASGLIALIGIARKQ